LQDSIFKLNHGLLKVSVIKNTRRVTAIIIACFCSVSTIPSQLSVELVYKLSMSEIKRLRSGCLAATHGDDESHDDRR
jgi:hypothetical protein